MTDNSDVVQKNKLLQQQVASLQAIEKLLAESQDRYRALSQATFEAIFISEKGLCIDSNAAAATLFGYSPDELIGIFGTDVIAPESRELVRDKMLSGSEQPYEAVGLRKDGSTFPCEIQGRMFDYRGRQVRATALRDISFQVEIQQRLQQSLKLEAVGTLAGGIAHDFNNLLTIILGQVALLGGHSFSPEIEASIQSIGRAGNRASTLINQLLTFSSQEPLQENPLDLNLAINDMMDMLRRLISEDITLQFKFSSTKPIILANACQLEQVVFNLVINARDAILSDSKNNNPKIIIVQTQTDSSGRAILDVSDTGVGIQKEQQARVFDPFFTTKAPSRGTGLGLATVYGIIKKNNGNISITSSSDSGTTFRITWPGTEQKPHKPAVIPTSEQKKVTGKVLLVEDDEDVLDVTATSLRTVGLQVETAMSAAQAMELIEMNDTTYDVLVTDEVMPGISGLELIAWLRLRSPETIFILMSGHTFDRIPSTKSLPDGVIFQPKPFMPGELMAKIAELL